MREVEEKDTGKRSNGEEEEGEEGEKLKTDTKKLWQLRAAWKKAECETARIEVGYFVSKVELNHENI